MRLRVNKAHFPVTTLGYGRRLGLWVQGCSIGCKDCVSQDTWDAHGGWTVDVAQVLDWCDARRGEAIDGITVSGGEPFEQPQGLATLLEALDRWRRGIDAPFDMLCYSGMPLQRLERRHPEILDRLDALIPEPYVHLRARKATSTVGRWRGSDNQPIVPLSALGQERYGAASEDDPQAPRLQVSVERGAVWFIGIPQPGDMARLQQRVAAKGVVLQEPSWRA